jgi:RHS repeat-associated protein
LAPAAPPLDEAYIFYFAGRPVAILKGNVPATLTRTYLTADHLGTPVLATSAAGVTVWAGGFEPFGADWSGAQGAGVFLRFPGQWEDASWMSGSLQSGLYYNIYRWYQSGVARYARPDPAASDFTISGYLFGDNRPTKYYDPLGLYSIDKSCACPQVDPPWSPKYPHESRPGIDQRDLQAGIDSWCSLKLYQNITDPKLRGCIEKSCDVGKVKCKDDCDVGEYVGLNRKVPLITNRIATVCTNAPKWHETPEELGNTVIHEWAHGCAWPGTHPEGFGVP